MFRKCGIKRQTSNPNRALFFGPTCTLASKRSFFQNQPQSMEPVQTKLHVNEPGDKFEQEADRVAEDITSGEAQKPANNENHRKSIQQQNIPMTSEKGFEGSGEPLSNELRTFFEPRMNVNLDGVRFHRDNEADSMNRELGARAFTHGSHVYFGRGQYDPHSADGKKLIAHELTHVVQQSGNGSKNNPSVGSNNVQLQPLTDTSRTGYKDHVLAEMGIVHTDYDVGAVQAERDIEAADQANANMVKSIFSVAMALIVPGFGGLVAGTASRFGVSIAESTANVIGSAIGEVAKNTGNSAIDSRFNSNPRQIFSAMTSGFEAAQRVQRQWIISNIGNHFVLPNHVLIDLATYWEDLAANNESSDWAEWFREQWEPYERAMRFMREGRRQERREMFGRDPSSQRHLAPGQTNPFL